MRSYWQDWDSNPMFLTPAHHTLPGPPGRVRVQNFIGASFLGRLSLVLNSPPPIWVRFILGTLSEASSLWWPAETQTLPRLFFLRPPHKPVHLSWSPADAAEPGKHPRARGGQTDPRLSLGVHSSCPLSAVGSFLLCLSSTFSAAWGDRWQDDADARAQSSERLERWAREPDVLGSDPWLCDLSQVC